MDAEKTEMSQRSPFQPLSKEQRVMRARRDATPARRRRYHLWCSADRSDQVQVPQAAVIASSAVCNALWHAAALPNRVLRLMIEG
jgi:hypothetical protein